MNIPVSSALITAHCHATEDEEKVLTALRALLPPDAEVKKTRVEGHYGNPIVLISARITRKPALSEIWKKIVKCGDQISPELEERIDELNNLHLRFDKQAAFCGRLSLTKGGDAIHVKLHVRAFPPKRENALMTVKKALERGAEDEA